MPHLAAIGIVYIFGSGSAIVELIRLPKGNKAWYLEAITFDSYHKAWHYVAFMADSSLIYPRPSTHTTNFNPPKA